MILLRTTTRSIIILLVVLLFLTDANAQYFNKIHQSQGFLNLGIQFNSDTAIVLGRFHRRSNDTTRAINSYYFIKLKLDGTYIMDTMFGFYNNNSSYNIFVPYNFNRLYEHDNTFIVTGNKQDSVNIGLPNGYYAAAVFVNQHNKNTNLIKTREWRNYSLTNPTYYTGHSVVSIDTNKIGVWLEAKLTRQVSQDYTTPDTAWLYILNTANNLDVLRAIPFTPTLPGNILVDVGNTQPNTAIIDNDKNIYLLFYEYNADFTSGRSNFYKIDTMGNVLAVKHFSPTENADDQIGYLSFGLANDGSVLISGMKTTAQGATCVFQKLDNTTLEPTMWVWGDVTIPFVGGTPNGFKKVIQSPTGYYYTINDAYNTQGYPLGGTVSKYTSTGTLIWKHTYLPGNQPDGTSPTLPRTDQAYLYDLALHPNGNVLVACGQAGITNTVGNSPRGWHGWLLGIDTLGCEVQNCVTAVDEPSPVIASPQGVAIYPNPASNQININLPTNTVIASPQGVAISLNDRAQIHIYDTQGQLVLQKNIEKGIGNLTLNINNLPKGMYLLSLINHKNETIGTCKFVKQ